MDPFTISLIAGGLGGVFQGLGQSKAAKEDRQFQERMAKMQRDWQLSDRREWEAKNKPQVPFYESRSAPAIDRVLAQAVLGNLGSRLGDNTNAWGINLDEIKSALQLNSPYGQTQDYGRYYGGGSEADAALRRKYDIPRMQPSLLDRFRRPEEPARSTGGYSDRRFTREADEVSRPGRRPR